jgi:hypothetical protein
MSDFRISNGDNFLEMGLAIEEDHALPGHNDAYITLKVQSGGFAGHNDLWAQAESMSAFCRALVALNKTLKGEALLESISPGELVLKVFSCNSRGGLAVEGSTGYHIIGEGREYWHAVSFGFEFEPTQLSALVQLPWVKRYAA